jgi:hypothetical protein
MSYDSLIILSYINDIFNFFRILNVDICPTTKQLSRCTALLWAQPKAKRFIAFGPEDEWKGRSI